jgi:RNA polymerase sigma factor (sigma-70 family)
MWSRPESDEALVSRMLPGANQNLTDRQEAWSEWGSGWGREAVLKFIRLANNTGEPDEDILQEALLTAYIEVERGRYRRIAGIPFTAYVKGIARNKIREARRRERGLVPLEDAGEVPSDLRVRHLEHDVEVKEARRALRQGLDTLPTARRQVLEQIIKGASTSEIARRMAISEELVRQHKCRGVRRIKQSIPETGL